METKNCILFYDAKEKWGELSNFFNLKTPITYQGKRYATSEHLYHCLKYITNPDRTDVHEKYAEEIRTTSTPYKSQLLANRWVAERYQWQKDLKKIIDKYDVEPRDDWDDVKDEMMLICLREKFKQCNHCKQVLLSTGKKTLKEHTTRDTYWGDGGDGTGLSKLGKLLMKVRDELLDGNAKAEEPEAATQKSKRLIKSPSNIPPSKKICIAKKK